MSLGVIGQGGASEIKVEQLSQSHVCHDQWGIELLKFEVCGMI
jgi:hypothetical protein